MAKGTINDAIKGAEGKQVTDRDRAAAAKVADTADAVFVECLQRKHDAHYGIFEEGEIYKVPKAVAESYNKKLPKPLFNVFKDEKEAQAAADKRAAQIERKHATAAAKATRSPDNKALSSDDTK